MSDKQTDKHRWLVSELRARSFAESDCYAEESVTVVVRTPEVAVFFAHWFEGRWYLGACARQGVTYVLPEKGDVVAACVEWAAGWSRTPRAGADEASWGTAAPPEGVAQFGLHQLSRAEISAWSDAMGPGDEAVGDAAARWGVIADGIGRNRRNANRQKARDRSSSGAGCSP